MPSPPMTPKRWVEVKGEKSSSGDLPLQRDLEFAPATLAFLRNALTAGLTRSDGWLLSRENSEKFSKSAADAASIYKRGVGFSTEAGNKSAPAAKHHQSKGEYFITFSSSPLRPEQLPQDGFLLLDDGFLRAHPGWKNVSCRHVVQISEDRKSLATVATIMREARRRKLAKHVPWILMGGGILTDLGGFAATLYGASFIMVPTTLLAMVDASLGGKTGVNFPPFGKNQLGRFAFPLSVKINLPFLNTLPQREWLAGGAECLKHALLTGSLPLLKATSGALQDTKRSSLLAILPRLIQVKARVVARDPTEIGERATLNLGHTFGHALESFSQERSSGDAVLMHGEAVAFGLVFSLLLSQHLGYLDSVQLKERLYLILASGSCRSLKTLTRCLKVSSLENQTLKKRLYELILGDKKREAGALKSQSFWVLISADGAVFQEKDKSYLVAVKQSDYDKVWTRFVQTINR